MSKITGKDAESLWWDSAQFVHDLRNRMASIDASAESFLRHWPELVEVYRAAVERGEVERPLLPFELAELTRMIQIMRHDAHTGRELVGFHWERLDGALDAPPRKWEGDGGKTLHRARERVTVKVTGEIEKRPPRKRERPKIDD